MAKRKSAYPVDKLGNVLGPEHYDPDELPSEEQVRRSHSKEFNDWFDKRIAKAKAKKPKP
jgi:hypothetical protein